MCPACTSSLSFWNDAAVCSNCRSRFCRRDATWDFTVGERADDQEDGEAWFREELQELNRVPNRLFPLDLCHRRSCSYAPRPHLPTEKLLLSLKDFRELFVEACGRPDVRALPTANYWSFTQLMKSTKSRVLAAQAGLFLRLNSTEFLSALFASVSAPWLVVMADR